MPQAKHNLNEVKVPFPNVDKRPYPEPDYLEKSREDITYPHTPAKGVPNQDTSYTPNRGEYGQNLSQFEEDIYVDVQGGVRLYEKRPGIIVEEDPIPFKKKNLEVRRFPPPNYE